MTDYTLEREYKIKNSIWATDVRIAPSDEDGVRVLGLKDGSYSVEEANAIAHAILHCIADIQHFQASIDEKLRPERVADRDGWIEHDGKGKPLSDDILVEVEFRDGGHSNALWVSSWHSEYEARSNWVHQNSPDDIMRYRVVPQ